MGKKKTGLATGKRGPRQVLNLALRTGSVPSVESMSFQLFDFPLSLDRPQRQRKKRKRLIQLSSNVTQPIPRRFASMATDSGNSWIVAVADPGGPVDCPPPIEKEKDVCATSAK